MALFRSRLASRATAIRLAAECVVGFIGNPPMNVLKATPQGGGKFFVAGRVFDGPAAVNSNLQFAIRLEDMTISVDSLPAVAKVVEPLGAHFLVTCELDGKHPPRSSAKR